MLDLRLFRSSFLVCTGLLLLGGAYCEASKTSRLFFEDFSSGLDQWDVIRGVEIRDGKVFSSSGSTGTWGLGVDLGSLNLNKRGIIIINIIVALENTEDGWVGLGFSEKPRWELTGSGNSGPLVVYRNSGSATLFAGPGVTNPLGTFPQARIPASGPFQASVICLIATSEIALTANGKVFARVPMERQSEPDLPASLKCLTLQFYKSGGYVEQLEVLEVVPD